MPSALITGASAGIGREFAVQLAARGSDLVLVARDGDRLRTLADELTSAHGIRAEVLVADLSDRAATQVVCDRLSDAARPIDLLVNNAGFGLRNAFLKNDIEEEERGLDVMVRAVLLTCHAAGRAMKARGSGRIINVSSVASFIASGTYSAEKSFVTVFSEALAGELKGSGVTVTALCPGFTRTEFHERAELSVSGLPQAVWLSAEQLVREALADADSGKVISVPGTQWKAIVTLLRTLPRPIVRSDALIARHRRRMR